MYAFVLSEYTSDSNSLTHHANTIWRFRHESRVEPKISEHHSSLSIVTVFIPFNAIRKSLLHLRSLANSAIMNTQPCTCTC